MKDDELKKFIEWYKTTEMFLEVPEHEKPIHLAYIIKKAMNSD